MSAAAPKQMNPLLAAYLRNLATNPLRTKAITTGMHVHVHLTRYQLRIRYLRIPFPFNPEIDLR